MSLPSEQEDSNTHAPDLRTNTLSNRHGSVCSCPQFWGLFTDAQTTASYPSIHIPDYDLNSSCQYSSSKCRKLHTPFSIDEGGNSRSAPPTSSRTPPLPTMPMLEPRSSPSSELKETCIFWYHGTCRRGADCHLEHELNHNWRISVPRAYTHDRRRCGLKFCPLRTDLVEMLRRYYPVVRNGAGAGASEDEMGGKMVEYASAMMVKGAEVENGEMEGGKGSTDEESNGDFEEGRKYSDEPVAGSAMATPNDEVESISSSASVLTPTLPASSQDFAHQEPMERGDDEKNQASLHTHEKQADAHSEVNALESKTRKKTRSRRRGKQKRQTRHEEKLITVQRKNDAVTSSASATPHPAMLEIVATSSSSLTPLPPGLPWVPLSPLPTSISHAGTREHKRKAFNYANNTPANKRLHVQSPTEHTLALKKHGLPSKPLPTPLVNRITHHESTTSRGPESSSESPGICFFWYHQGYCQPKRLRNGRTLKCRYLHKVVPGEKVSLPRSIRHNVDCSLPLCPVSYARKDGEGEMFMDYGRPERV